MRVGQAESSETAEYHDDLKNVVKTMAEITQLVDWKAPRSKALTVWISILGVLWNVMEALL